MGLHGAPAAAGYEAGMLQAGAQAAVSGVVAAPEYYYPEGPYQYDPYYGNLMYNQPLAAAAAPIGGQARLALPTEIMEEEPVYVNAKQYHCILRRRQQRAKAEAENKLIKTRRPYLHQSRHNHATRRIRGAGGRFLTAQEAKALEQSGELSGNSNSGAASSQPSDSQADSRTQQPPAPAEPASQGAGQNVEWNNTAAAAAAAPPPQGQTAGEQQPSPQDHIAQQNVPVQQKLDQAINSSQLAAGAAVRVQ
ncbi:g9712 [Coccomyxa elongata]